MTAARTVECTPSFPITASASTRMPPVNVSNVESAPRIKVTRNRLMCARHTPVSYGWSGPTPKWQAAFETHAARGWVAGGDQSSGHDEAIIGTLEPGNIQKVCHTYV